MLEYCVLLLLKQRPSYASDIIQQLKNAELLVVEGTLYPLLTRLKNDGLLQYEWQESTQGPPRKYYALSPEGEKFLEGLDAAWNELSSTINYLKNIQLSINNQKYLDDNKDNEDNICRCGNKEKVVKVVQVVVKKKKIVL